MFSRISSIFIVSIMLIAIVGVIQAIADIEANKAIALSFFEELINQRNFAVADEIFATQSVYKTSAYPDIIGPEGFKGFLTEHLIPFPDAHYTIDDIVAEGDKVATRWTFNATHQDELMGIPPTGNQVTLTAISIFQIVDGKIEIAWTVWDALGMMQQVGAMPSDRESYTWGEPKEVTGEPGEPETNKALINSYLDAISGKDKPAATVDEYVADSDEELKQHIAFFEAGFPRYELIAEDMIAERDKVVVRITFRGTHKSELMDIPPTGKQVAMPLIITYRIADGKIVEHWMSADQLGFMQQLTAPPPGTTGELITDTIYSPSLEGNLLGDAATRNMLIYLPPSYNTSDKRYPVVYLLHMHAHDETEAADHGVPDILDELIALDQMKEMLFVMLNADNKYGGSWYTSSELIGNYEGYIVHDIVDYIDANYRTIASPDSRAIAGGPMGGNGAITLAMKHPGVYGAVASHGGTLSFNVAKGVFAQAVIAQTPDGMMTPEEAYQAHHEGLYFPSYAYAMSAAFSPNLDNPPYFVDLPLEWPSPDIIEDVWSRWLENGDALTMLSTYGHNLASLRGLYIDSETPDSVGADFMADAFHQALDAAGIQHEFGLYPAEEEAEDESFYSRFRVSMPFVSDVLLHEEDLEAYTNVFFTSLAAGLNMISLPLMPIKPYTARSFAEEIDATVIIQLDEARQRFMGFTLDAPDDGFAIEGGKGYIVNVPEGRVVAFTGAAWTNEPLVEAAPEVRDFGYPMQTDGAWAFVVSGRILELESSAFAVTVRNTRTNEIATDVVRSGYFAAAFADLTRKDVVQIGDRLEVQVRNQAGEIASEMLTYTVTEEFIRQAFLPITLRDIGKPRHSMLLPNYPNPFNPETWIPYQLRESTDVVVRIYSAQGRLVRTLSLGQQAAGFYLEPTKAAYWNGRNASGEKVASGIYFYQLHAGDFSSTRRMLIIK